MTALGEGEEASNDSERGELIEDEEAMGSARLGRNRVMSSAAQAELKVFRPLGFLTKPSFGSCETCRFPGFRSGAIRLWTGVEGVSEGPPLLVDLEYVTLEERDIHYEFAMPKNDKNALGILVLRYQNIDVSDENLSGSFHVVPLDVGRASADFKRYCFTGIRLSV